MKKITIGRGRDCDIRLDDSSDTLSRKHAVITVTPTGKKKIYDLSSNGTYVNGVRVEKPNGYPVKKGDRVNFANLVDLDWSKYRDPYRKAKTGILATVAVVVLAAVAVPLIWYNGNTDEVTTGKMAEQTVDSVAADEPVLQIADIPETGSAAGVKSKVTKKAVRKDGIESRAKSIAEKKVNKENAEKLNHNDDWKISGGSVSAEELSQK